MRQHGAARRAVAPEFQRLHGMGEALYAGAARRYGEFPLRVYAPVGSHEDLLPYLVRRLLENGANTSFVHALLDERTPVEKVVADPDRRGRGHRRRAAPAHPPARRPLRPQPPQLQRRGPLASPPTRDALTHGRGGAWTAADAPARSSAAS